MLEHSLSSTETFRHCLFLTLFLKMVLWLTVPKPSCSKISVYLQQNYWLCIGIINNICTAHCYIWNINIVITTLWNINFNKD